MEKKFAVVLVALLLSVFLVSAAEYSVNAVSSADDWPMFNHDAAHSSYSSGPVPTNPTLLWTFPNPNITAINLEDINYLIATPAVSNGYLYTSGINNTSNLYCLNASTGKLIWVSPEKGINSPSSPAVVNGMVYMGTINLMSAFNASTGELIWNASAKEDNDGYTPAVAMEWYM
jgi:outer membrane protein assembly factor BamB